MSAREQINQPNDNLISDKRSMKESMYASLNSFSFNENKMMVWFIRVVSRSVSIDQLDVEQQTELMHKKDTIWAAIFRADRDAIEKFIEKNPEIINERGPVGECPIHLLFLLASDECLSIARDLIERFPNIVTQIYNKPVRQKKNKIYVWIREFERNVYTYRYMKEKIFSILRLWNVIRQWSNGY